MLTSKSQWPVWRDNMVELSKDYGKVEAVILGTYVEPERPRYPTRADLAETAAAYIGMPTKVKKERIKRTEIEKSLDLPTSATRRSARLNRNTVIIGGVSVDVPDTEPRPEPVKDITEEDSDDEAESNWSKLMEAEVNRLEKEVQATFKTHYDKYEKVWFAKGKQRIK